MICPENDGEKLEMQCNQVRMSLRTVLEIINKQILLYPDS